MGNLTDYTKSRMLRLVSDIVSDRYIASDVIDAISGYDDNMGKRADTLFARMRREIAANPMTATRKDK